MFGQPNGSFSPAKQAPSGPELMLRQFGLGDVIEAAKQLAGSGSIQKIMAFSDALPELMKTLGEINGRLEHIERTSGLSPLFDASAGGGGAEPGPGPGSPGDVGNGSNLGTVERDGPNREP